jgi:hypothetical protein
MKLKHAFPELIGIECIDERAYRFRDVKVVKEHSGVGVKGGKIVDICYKKWIGIHKYVHNWVKLANGYAVGMNENPSRGLSFPVVRIKKK